MYQSQSGDDMDGVQKLLFINSIQIQIPLLSFVQQYIKGYYNTIKDDDTHIQTHTTN